MWLAILMMRLIFGINLLTSTQLSRSHKAYANNSLTNIKLWKTQLNKIGQSGGFSGRRLG